MGNPPFPEGGQVRPGERDHAECQVEAADRDRAGRRLSLRTTVGGTEERPLVRAARPIAAEPGQAAVSGVILCGAAGRFRVPEVEVLAVDTDGAILTGLAAIAQRADRGAVPSPPR